MEESKEMINGDTVVLTAAHDGNRALTLTLTVNGTPQKMILTSASVPAGSPKGILVSGRVDPTNGKTPATITLQNPPISGGTYDFVELSVPPRRPNPRVVVKVIIP